MIGIVLMLIISLTVDTEKKRKEIELISSALSNQKDDHQKKTLVLIPASSFQSEDSPNLNLMII